jgi:hypothetical protein
MQPQDYMRFTIAHPLAASSSNPHPASCPPLVPPPSRRKVSKAYFALLEVLCHGHTATIAATDAATFNYILTSLEQVGPRLLHLCPIHPFPT